MCVLLTELVHFAVCDPEVETEDDNISGAKGGNGRGLKERMFS